MEQIVTEILSLYGPLAIGWLAAAALFWMVILERRKVGPFQKIADAYHQSMIENTRALERLATIIEERTRRR